MTAMMRLKTVEILLLSAITSFINYMVS